VTQALPVDRTATHQASRGRAAGLAAVVGPGALVLAIGNTPAALGAALLARGAGRTGCLADTHTLRTSVGLQSAAAITAGRRCSTTTGGGLVGVNDALMTGVATAQGTIIGRAGALTTVIGPGTFAGTVRLTALTAAGGTLLAQAATLAIRLTDTNARGTRIGLQVYSAIKTSGCPCSAGSRHWWVDTNISVATPGRTCTRVAHDRLARTRTRNNQSGRYKR